jgi:hypothetical protein
MIDDEAHRILDEARDNCERLADLKPRARPLPERGDRNTRWQREAEAERAAQQSLTDAEREAAATSVWQQWIIGQIRNAMTTAATGIAEAIKEKFDQIDEGIAARDRKLDKMEADLARAQAEIAKLQVRVLQGETDRDRDRRSSEFMPMRGGI